LIAYKRLHKATDCVTRRRINNSRRHHDSLSGQKEHSQLVTWSTHYWQITEKKTITDHVIHVDFIKPTRNVTLVNHNPNPCN